MKKLFKIFIFSMLFFSIVSKTYIYSKEEVINKKIEIAKTNMKNDEIDKESYNKILSKLKRGEILDSQKENSTVISTKTYSKNGFKYYKKIFKDKSYRLTKITDVDFLVNNMLKSGKNVFISNWGTVITKDSFHTRINGAEVKSSSASHSVYFNFDFTLSRTEGVIHNVYSPFGYSDDGKLDIKYPIIINSNSSYGNPARAELSYSLTKEEYRRIKTYSYYFGIKVTSTEVIPY